jgi:arylsulfatase A-like enzyme
LPALQTPHPKKPVRDFAIHHSLWGVFAVRQGPWKMIPHCGSGGFTAPKELDAAKVGLPPGQLYNLEEDPSETKNLWDEHPEIVARLQKILDQVQTAEN